MESIDRVPKHLRHCQKWIPCDKIRRSYGAEVLQTRLKSRVILAPSSRGGALRGAWGGAERFWEAKGTLGYRAASQGPQAAPSAPGSPATSTKSFSAANTTLMDDRSIASMYFCTGNRFPIELRAIEHSKPHFRNLLGHPGKNPFYFTPCTRGGDIADELENVAHVLFEICRLSIFNS